MNGLKQTERRENGESDPSNTIARSVITNSAITSSYVRRSTLDGCVLSHVRSAHRMTGHKTHFHDVDNVRRSDFSDSVIRDKSSVTRSTIVESTIRDVSAIKRSSIAGSTISSTRMTRTLLKDCAVENCVIMRSQFKDMVLKNGIWKKGQLIGRVGAKIPIAIRKDDSEISEEPASSSHLLPNAVPDVPELDSKSIPQDDNAPQYIDSDFSLDSEDSDEEDIPPPYKV